MGSNPIPSSRICDEMEFSTKIELFLLRPIFLILIILLLPYYLANFLDGYLNLPKVFNYPINLAGLIFIIFGILLDLLAIKAFFKAGGTPLPWKPPKKLVVTGPFRYTRNPIYLAWAFMISGVAIYTNLLALFIIMLLFMATVHFGIVLGEESKLVKRFGKQYLEYKKKVPRWIPKVG